MKKKWQCNVTTVSNVTTKQSSNVIVCQASWKRMGLDWWLQQASRFWSAFIASKTNMEQFKWEHLPDVVIIEVYKYLSDEEKVNAALTCKNWGRMYYTPCLWRKRHFDIGGYRVHANGLKACQFASLHGRHVRNLSLSCSHPSYHTAKLFQKTMEELLFKMRHAKLIEFELERLELERFLRYEASRDRLISNFVRFFRYQNHLQEFDMTSAQFPAVAGIRILETIGNNCGHITKEMFLEDFFNSRAAIFQVPRYLNTLSLFKNLEFLATNYNCVSEEVILLFAKTLRGKLDMLHIKVGRHDPRFQRISGNAWTTLKRACPKLVVTLWFENIGNMHEIVPILSKEIPLRDFHIWTGYDDEADWRLNDTLRHLHTSYKHIIGMKPTFIHHIQVFNKKDNTVFLHSKIYE